MREATLGGEKSVGLCRVAAQIWSSDVPQWSLPQEPSVAEKDAPIGVARYVQNWAELHNRHRSRDARAPWLSGNGRCIHLPALKLVLTTVNERMLLLAVPAPGQSNGCIEMRTQHRTRSPPMCRPASNEGV